MRAARAAAIFDIVEAYVQELSTVAFTIHSTPNTGGSSTRIPQGDVRLDYISDFQIAGRRVLANKPRQLLVFKVCYCERKSYTEALKETKLKSGTLKWYRAEIRKAVGPELERIGLYPPSQYRKRISEDSWAVEER